MKQTLVLLFVILFATSKAQLIIPEGHTNPFKTEIDRIKNPVDIFKFTGKKIKHNQNKSIDAIGSLENYVGFTKDSLGEYQESFKSDFIYDQNDQQAASYQSIWEDNSWNLSSKDTLIYNDVENTFERIYSAYTNNSWAITSSIFEQYDEFQNVTLELRSQWVDESFIVVSQKEFFYYENILDSLIESYYNGVEMILDSKQFYFYDENGFLIMIKYYSWNFDNWVESTVVDYENNATGNVLIQWHINNNDTVIKIEYFYNALNIDTLILGSRKDSNNIFQPEVKEIYVYDDAGNLIEFNLEYFENETWELFIFQSTIHDIDELASDYNYPKYWIESFELVNLMTEFTQLWKIDSAVYNDTKFVFNYSLIDGIDKHEAASIRVYPNPASHQITIENPVIPNASIEVYNLSGVLLYNEFQQGTEVKIDLSPFPAGNYIVRVFNNESSKVVKIVKE